MCCPPASPTMSRRRRVSGSPSRRKPCGAGWPGSSAKPTGCGMVSPSPPGDRYGRSRRTVAVMGETRSAAILAADAVGYSHAAETNEALALQALASSRQLIDPLIETYGGRVFKTAGDSVLAVFRKADAAVHCGLRLQEE